jgi:hypothetical protein
MISAVNGVRSRITQMTSNGASREMSVSTSETWSLKNVSSAESESGDQSAHWAATFW